MSRRPDGRALLACLLLALTLVPLRHSLSAVAYCVGVPIVLLAIGYVLGRLPIGAALAARAEGVGVALRRSLLAPGRNAFAVTIGLGSLLACAASVTLLMEQTPGMLDSAVYLFQAKILAAGRLAAEAPALPAFFENNRSIISDGRWYSQYPPGYPALLAAGVLAGAPWLVNPVLSGLNAVLVYRLGLELFGELEARVAAVVAGLSPFVLLMSSDYTSNPAGLLFATLFLLAVARFVRGRNAGSLALAGAAGAACFAVRPYTAVALCLVPAIVAIGVVAQRRALGAALAGAVGAASVLALFGLYNLGTTGDPFVLGYTKAHGVSHAPGFGMSDWDGRSWVYLTRGMLRQLATLNRDLFQMPFPALALVAAAFVLRRPRGWELVLLLSFVSLVGFHYFYYWASFYLGPRFLFEGVTGLALLSARGLTALGEAWTARPPPPAWRRGTVLAITLAVTLVFPAALSARLLAVRQGYSDPVIVREIERLGVRDALVFAPFVPVDRYSACYALNEPALDGPVICARDLGEENARLRQLHPDRQAYRWESGRLVRLP